MLVEKIKKRLRELELTKARLSKQVESLAAEVERLAPLEREYENLIDSYVKLENNHNDLRQQLQELT